MIKEVKIEKNVPLPKPRNRYPWHKMEVGDSIIASSSGIVGGATKATGFKFVARKVNGGGVRIWRIE